MILLRSAQWVCLLCALVLLPACLTGRRSQPPEFDINPCSLLQEPQRYDRQVLTVSGYLVISGEERAELYLPGCGESQIWVEFSPDFATRTEPQWVRRIRTVQARTRPTWATKSNRGPNVMRIGSDRVAIVAVGRFDAVVPAHPLQEKDRFWDSLGGPVSHPSSYYKHQFTVTAIQRIARVPARAPWE